MAFPQSFLDEIKGRVSLSAVIGRKVAWDRGKSNPRKGDFWGCCPFHNEKSASFHADDGKGFYHCFGCAASGDAIAFLTETEGLTFVEAVTQLAAMAGLPLPDLSPAEKAQEAKRHSLLAGLEAATLYFAEALSHGEKGQAAREYLAGRAVPDSQQAEFRLGLASFGGGAVAHLRAKGFADDAIVAMGIGWENVTGSKVLDFFFNRVMFPIADARGRVVGFSGRTLSSDPEAPKYLNTPETSLFRKGALLYNHHRAKDAARAAGEIIACEGNLDVAAFDRAGLAHVVAPLGTAITEAQLALLWRMAPEPLLALDGDRAGLKAASRAIDAALPLLKPGQSLRFALLPDGKDPDQIMREEGADALKAAIAAPVPLIDLLWRRLTKRADVSTPERRAAFETEIADTAALIADGDVRKQYEAELSTRLRAFWKEKGIKPTVVSFTAAKKRRKAAKAEGEGPPAAGFGAAEIAQMNGRYALVIVGQKAVILDDGLSDHSIERVRFLSIDGFKTWLLNCRARIDGEWKSHAELWLTSPKRRQFEGVEFTPAAPSEPAADVPTKPGWYNLARGYDCTPVKDYDLAIPWLKHVKEIVAGGNDEHARWIVSWFASIVQFPRRRFGTSLVLRGGQGYGKTITGKIVGKLFPAHYFLIDSPRYLIGNFNAHLVSCLLLQADEGFWAGDKEAEGRLKGLITSDFQMIEFKGIDAIRFPNYVRLMISSNEDWVVPSALDERRFAIFDVSPSRARDLRYFSDLDGMYERPEARAALLYELMHWKIDDALMREVPKTQALLEQKIRTFDGMKAWLFEALSEGAFAAGADWPDFLECKDLHDNYVRRCERMGVAHPLGRDSFGSQLKKFLPEVARRERVKDKGQRKVWCYLLPKLPAARAAFARIMGQEVEWRGDGEFAAEEPIVAL